MSWTNETKCPVCSAPRFVPMCDEVDIGVGVQEGNLGGMCNRCGMIAQCQACGDWLPECVDGRKVTAKHVCSKHYL